MSDNNIHIIHDDLVANVVSSFIIVPERIINWLTRTLPVRDNDYDEPLQYRTGNTIAANIELHPSMIPFVTQFRVEEDDECNRKVLVTYAAINHNKLILHKCAEIANNLAGNPTRNKFTQEPQIGQGLELFFYKWNKASCVSYNYVFRLSAFHHYSLIRFYFTSALNASSPNR